MARSRAAFGAPDQLAPAVRADAVQLVSAACTEGALVAADERHAVGLEARFAALAGRTELQGHATKLTGRAKAGQVEPGGTQ